MLTFRLELSGQVLSIEARNSAKKAITIVTHPRYWTVELKNARNQFVGATAVLLDFPAATDFVTIASGETTTLTISVNRDDFKNVPAKTSLRIIYKADGMVPNLPSKQRDSFFRGPADGAVEHV